MSTIRRSVATSEWKVSVVVATLDRPADLLECLSALIGQNPGYPFEIIVVDNNPLSGLTRPVVADFPGVRLVTESRRGLAYARNRGILAATGGIIVTTDDDVIVPSGWLEKLLVPFVDPDVMVVTGNILPWRLETRSQRLFESYGGLGRGNLRRAFDGSWFNGFISAVPTWSVGATANAAFRASIFNDPNVGLMDEALGPGMPSGVGEDTYLFYKVLKAGHTIIYEPEAWVWHKHRREMPALRRQLFEYSKGHVAYHLTTLLRDSERRAVIYLALILPAVHIRRALRSMLGWSDYPLGLIMLEIAGNLAGPWALWRSRRRVAREGRS